MKKAELEVEVQKIEQEDRRAGYERQLREDALCHACLTEQRKQRKIDDKTDNERLFELMIRDLVCAYCKHVNFCLLYTSPSPRDGLLSRMPSSA